MIATSLNSTNVRTSPPRQTGRKRRTHYWLSELPLRRLHVSWQPRVLNTAMKISRGHSDWQYDRELIG